jgi:hypothetical protein
MRKAMVAVTAFVAGLVFATGFGLVSRAHAADKPAVMCEQINAGSMNDINSTLASAGKQGYKLATNSIANGPPYAGVVCFNKD